jgi:hypothetical protein
MEGESVVPQYFSKVKVLEEETYASLRVRLEEKSTLEWPFQFWDNEDRCRIWQKMEGLNDVVSDVYVLPLQCEVEEAPKRRRLDDGIHVADRSLQEVANFLEIDEDVENHLVEPLGSSRVTGSTGITEALEHQIDSTLIPKDIWKLYLEHAEKMNRDLKCHS